MKGKARRLLSWVCVLALCMSLLPVTALAVEQNVPTEGNSESYVQNGTPTTKDEVTVSKTAKWTEQNAYEITLSVTVPGNVTIPGQSTDVVLVIDASSSMEGSNIQAAKRAARSFAQKLLAEDISADVNLAVVTYTERPSIECNLTDDLGKVTSAINDITIRNNQGTNIQAGVYQARQLLKDSEASNQVIVLLSDGEPTYSYPVRGTCGIDHEDGIFGLVWHNSQNVELPRQNAVTEEDFDYTETTGNGNSYLGVNAIVSGYCDDCKGKVSLDYDGEKKPYNNNGDPAIAEARFAKTAGCEIYSLYLGDPSEEATHTMKGIATDVAHYKQANQNSLSDLLEQIAGDVTSTTAGAVTDPMGENIVLGDVSGLAGVTETEDGLAWDPTKSEGTTNEDESTTYTVTYPITVNTDDPDFKEGWYPANGITTFTYQVNGEQRTIEFNVPSVWGENPVHTNEVYIQVFLDDTNVTQNWQSYLSNLTTTGTTEGMGDPEYKDNHIVVPYAYEDIDAADVQFGIASGYVLQGVQGTFVYGSSGWNGVKEDCGTWTVDNVDGDTILSVYLNTAYSVEYKGYGAEGITDSNIYINQESVNESQAPDFAGINDSSSLEARNQGKNGSWKNPAENIKTEIAVAALPAHAEGWTNEADGTTEGGKTLTVQDALNDGLNKGDSVFTFTATAATYTVTYTDGVKDEVIFEDQVTSNLTFGSATPDFNGELKRTGYTFAGWSPKVEETVSGDVTYTAQWTKDDSQTQATTYTVKYTLEGVEQTQDTVTVEGKAWINDNPAQIAIAEGGIPAPADKYTGYKLDPANPVYPAAGTLVNSGTEYVVNYVKDETQVKELQYTVEYYKDNVKQEKDTDTVTEDVWINSDQTTLTVKVDEINITNKYEGYAFDYTDPAQIPETIQNGGVIKVYYATDNNDDDIPDKYQVTVHYTTDDEGKIADDATTTEVLTILDEEGNRVETGTVAATGSTAEAKDADAFFFDHWTLKTSEEGTEINQDSLNATFEKYPLANVSGGDVITFKAYFTAKTYSLDVSKTLTSVGNTEITEDMTNVPMAKVGEDIVWTITVRNTGNQPLNQVTVTDTMTGGPSGSVSLTSNEEEENVSISGAVATIQTLEVGSSVEITATYEVQEADAGKSLNNTAVASDEDSHQDEETPKDPVVVEKPELSILKKAEITGTTVTLGDQINYTITVTNTGNVNLTDVTVTDNRMPNSVNVAIGEGEETSAEVSEGKVTIGTLAKGQDATITYSYTVTAADVVTGKVENSATGDSEQTAPTDPSTTETTVSDPGAVTVTPADITLYTGGTGYSGIVGNDGNIVDNPTNGLPEPGYYIELPEALNKALLDALDLQKDTVLDLSDYVTFTYNDGTNARTWALALYDEDGTSQAYGKNVYRLLPAAEGQDPVRLQITGDTVEEGGVLTDDVFEIHLDGDLYREYNMAIYSGTLDPGQVKLTFKTNNQLGELSGKSYSVDAKSGALTIRGVTDSQETAVVGQKTDSGFSASVPNGTTYTINDSDIGVNDSSNIQLLVDDIVTAGDDADAAAVTEALQTKAAEALENTTLTNPTYEMKYMDLVDGNNGNVYVTPSQNVTITWPVRGDAAEGTDFYVVHFDGLDREFSGAEAADKINATTPEVLTVTEAEDGSITFTTDSFSPFVLVYNQKDAAAPSLTVDKELTAVNEKAPGSSVSVNDTLTYTITVTNNGNVDLTGVSVKDTFNGKGTLNFAASDDYTVTNNNDGTYTITLNSNLAVDKSVKITATYKVLRGDANGTLTNAVSVTGKTTDGTEIPTPGGDTEETPVNPYRPPIRPPEDPDKPELNTEDHYAYIVGYEDGSVQPEGDITRAEVATIFFRLLTDESRNEYWSQTNPYSDVSADDWFNNAVSTLTNAGVLDGYEDGTFKPNGNITRAEFATITARFFEATYDGENLFPDIAGHWAQDYINEAANAGIVNGYEDGTFRPQQYITRAEAVTMVNRTIERHPDADHLLDDMITWPDNPETAWYYEQIQEATNSHKYTMNTDDEQNPYEIWTKLLPNRDWSELEKEWSDANDGAGSGEVV